MTDHFGHRDNPVVVTEPYMLDRACGRAWDPTPDQADAGNYKMTHAVIGGLQVTIETPRGRMRHGAGEDGKPWSVQMPCHYGYAKRTIASDGDNVDVYVGPEAHRAMELPVWVMDQRDKDTKAYDEPKTFVGFPDRSSAHRAYLGAFSDGRGQDRIGGVVRMTFEAFRRWLGSGDTKKPVAMRKSASASATVASYVPPTCECEACNGTSGGSMTESAAKADPSVTWLGKMSSIVTKGIASLSPSERSEFLADAATRATAELGKASESLTRHENEMKYVDQVEDQWDGPADDHLEVGGGHGPGSSAPAGKVNVGPEQRASGDGAEKMERDYSRHAPAQTGVQAATEHLGEAIMGVRKSMKAMGAGMRSIVSAMEAQGMQIDLLKSSAAGSGPDAAAIEKMIGDAVAKAMRPVMKSVTRALQKADEEKDDEKDTESEKESGKDDEEEDEEEDDEASEEESGSGTEIEIVNENDAEDEDEAEADKAITAKAARLRIMAKGRIKWANRRLTKAAEAGEAGKPLKMAKNLRKARFNLRKARDYRGAAIALRDGNTGPSSIAIGKAITKAEHRAKRSKAENQDVWPNKGEIGGHGKSQVGAVQPDVSKAVQTALEQMNKAASGMGMLVTNMQGLMESVAGQSRNGGNGVPPALKLAIGKAGDKDAQLVALADNGAISFDDLDAARDVMRLASTPVPPDFVNQKIARLPPAVRTVLTGQAA